MARKKSPIKVGQSPEDFMRALHQMMKAQADAQSLNDNVITPFAAALEEICAARGYVLNIYGETSNIVFSGAEEDAEAIYQLVEDYLNAKGDQGGKA